MKHHRPQTAHPPTAGRRRTRAGLLTLALLFALPAAALAPSAAFAAPLLDIPSLSADVPHQLPGATATLTMTSSVDVGPTPYYLEIFDQTTGVRVQSCATGTSCSVPVTYNYATTHTYIAYRAGYSTTNPPPNIARTTNTQTVTWGFVALNATQSSYSGPATLTARTLDDVGPTPYYIEIFDQTTGQLVTSCATGKSCSATVSFPFPGHGTVTHVYVAYTARWGATNPPPTITATSAPVPVTWSNPS